MENLGDPIGELASPINNLLKECELLSAILEVAFQEGHQLYLVGGLIRDLLLGYSSKDADFVTSRASDLAMLLTERTGCRPVLIDRKYGTIRLIPATTSVKKSEVCLVDLSPLRGPSIEYDLLQRDFTVNAMAIDISAWKTNNGNLELLDPLGGLSDLRANRLRFCSPDSFTDDPLRILRAYRLVSRYGFVLDPQTRKHMGDLRQNMDSVAVERIRDELVLILTAANSASILRMLDEDGILGELLPECEPMRNLPQDDSHHQDVWQQSLSVLEALEFFLARPQELLGSYGEHASALLAQRIAGERDRQTMLKFAALVHNIGKPSRINRDNDGSFHFHGHQVAGAALAVSLCSRLRFSNKEIYFVSELVRQHMRPIHLFNLSRSSGRALTRFFRLGPELFWSLLLLLGSNEMARQSSQSPNGTTRQLRQCIRNWLDFYYQQLEPRAMEPPLLNGRELMEHLDLSPGPIVGKLLQNLADLQWDGRITGRDEALQHAAQLQEKWTKRG